MEGESSSNVVSTGQPVVNYQFAGFGRRLIANIIDALIIIAIGAAMRLVFHSSLLANLTGAFYAIILWVNNNGATIGKKAMGIRVVRIDDKPLDYFTAIIRYLGYYISGFILFLGFIWIIFDSKKQGWHDKIAGTYVVRV